MKTYKESANKQKSTWKNSPVSFPGSFAEQRENLPSNLHGDELTHEECKKIYTPKET